MDPQIQSLTYPQTQTLLTNFTTFLTTTLHTLLRLRNLYPPSTFLTTRWSPHNLLVYQSRHPRVCAWIAEAVASVRSRLGFGGVSRVVFSVHDGGGKGGKVVERWVFDVSSFPAFGEEKTMMEEDELGGGDFEEDVAVGGDESGLAGVNGGGINWVDVQEQFRGALRRISYAGEKMDPLPDGCTFTLAVELKDDAPAPVEHPQAWIPSEPNMQPNKPPANDAKTTPVRSVEAGPLFFECWVEESSSQDTRRWIDAAREKERPKGREMPLA